MNYWTTPQSLGKSCLDSISLGQKAEPLSIFRILARFLSLINKDLLTGKLSSLILYKVTDQRVKYPEPLYSKANKSNFKN